MKRFNYLKNVYLAVALAFIVSVCLVPRDADATTTYFVGDDRIDYSITNDKAADIYQFDFDIPTEIDNYMTFGIGNPVDWQVAKIDTDTYRVTARGPPLFVGDTLPAGLLYDVTNPAPDNPWYGQDIRDLALDDASLSSFSEFGTYLGTDNTKVARAPTPSTEIPTLSEWGMIIFFLLLVGSAVVVMRKRTREIS